MARERPRILTVDDDKDWLELIGELLTAEGYAVTSANDGARALTLLPKVDPDVVVTDVQMPEMDGRALLAAIRARTPRLPVIVLTGDKFEARAPGFETAFRVIEKPPPVEELLDVLADAAGRRPAPMAAVAPGRLHRAWSSVLGVLSPRRMLTLAALLLSSVALVSRPRVRAALAGLA